MSGADLKVYPRVVSSQRRASKAYYSTVLDHPADVIWSVIRPFDHYSWAGVPGETVIEDGNKGDYRHRLIKHLQNAGFAVWLLGLRQFHGRLKPRWGWGRQLMSGFASVAVNVNGLEGLAWPKEATRRTDDAAFDSGKMAWCGRAGGAWQGGPEQRPGQAVAPP